jgi:2-polyprenyl-6-methoxyphenol hydroxylase-like FAD-dependent oxidoreductase
LKEVGAGIGLSPNAVRVLKHLGLMNPVVNCGTVIEAAASYTWDGAILSRLPMNRMDAPAICLHRADLQQVLFSALPSDCVHLGEEFIRFTQTGDEVKAHFASGRTGAGGALIGADGLRSKVRAQIIGDGEPIYRGYQCWRGVCDEAASNMLIETFGPGFRMGLVPIGHRGTAWWFTANEVQRMIDEPDGAKAKLQRWVANWHQPIPDVIRRTDASAIIKTDICDRLPTRRWSKASCTLLGDAAHPTTPNMGQGGCMAIEDAVVLARCLSDSADTSAAFHDYERIRYARTRSVTNISRYYGVIGQWKSPGAVWLRKTLFRLTPESVAAKSYNRFAGYDPAKNP